MLSLSPIKIVILVAVILVVLGPDKLPDVAHQIGSAWRSLKEWQSKIEKEVRDVVPDLPSSSDIVRMARSPVNLLNSLADRVTGPDEPDEDEVTPTKPVEFSARAQRASTTDDTGPPVDEDAETLAHQEPPHLSVPSEREGRAPLPADPSLN